MQQNRKYSLFYPLFFTIFGALLIVVLVRSFYDYVNTKKEVSIELQTDVQTYSDTLKKSVAGYVASYSSNEYEKLIRHTMGDEDILAIIVDDFTMANILGEESYVSGFIRDKEWKIEAYDRTNETQKKLLKSALFVERKELLDENLQTIGVLSIYMSDRYLEHKVERIIVQNIITSALLALMLIILIFLTINSFIMKPLKKILKVIQESDHEGIPKEYFSQGNSKEMQTLTSSMNKMISSIRKSRERLKEQEKNLVFQAHHDPLTNLPNRLLFQDRLMHGIQKADREGSRLALFFIDLDHFKEVNDSYGHEIGDILLQNIAQRLQGVIRANDTLARLGGDEFTIIMESLKESVDISRLAQKILNSLSDPLVIDGNTLYISSSIGISLYPNDAHTVQDLLKFADTAMYKAKDEGRNNFQFYNAKLTEIAYERVMLEVKIREALKNEEFVVYFQPQIDIRNKEISGMEALVRWQHPEKGLVYPDVFIPLAESTGLIVELDRYVMKAAMEQMALWHKAGLKPGVLAMNLSVKQLERHDFIDTFKRLMYAVAIQPEWLELEITESQLMRNPQDAIKVLQELSALGISLSVDDFGTGYSSFAYLKKLPISKLKIDREFIKDIPKDEEDIAITKAIIVLAKSLNLKVLAEGVETEEQRDFLLENDCRYVQGYFYAKPIDSSSMEKLLLAGVKDK